MVAVLVDGLDLRCPGAGGHLHSGGGVTGVIQTESTNQLGPVIPHRSSELPQNQPASEDVVIYDSADIQQRDPEVS
jgi:hypothetical protein